MDDKVGCHREGESVIGSVFPLAPICGRKLEEPGETANVASPGSPQTRAQWRDLVMLSEAGRTEGPPCTVEASLQACLRRQWARSLGLPPRLPHWGWRVGRSLLISSCQMEGSRRTTRSNLLASELSFFAVYPQSQHFCVNGVHESFGVHVIVGIGLAKRI